MGSLGEKGDGQEKERNKLDAIEKKNEKKPREEKEKKNGGN